MSTLDLPRCEWNRLPNKTDGPSPSIGGETLGEGAWFMVIGPTSAETVLSVRGVSKSFGPVEVLHDVSVDLRAGEVHAFVGENGAGKSTLAKIMSGYHQPSAGEVLLDGTPLSLTSGVDGERHGLVLLHQEFNLADDLTVEESIFLGREWLRGPFLDKRRMRARSTQLLADLHCSVPPTTRIRSLSVSQKQMVEIAKATDHQARVLMMDEPTSVLTQDETDILFRLIHQLKERRVAIAFISHKLNEVKKIADRITVLRDGQLVATRAASELDQEEIAQLMVGRSLHDLYPAKRPPAANAQVLLAADCVSVPGRVFDASFMLRRGEILGFAGLIGAGRTELMEAVAGLRPRTGGKVSCGDTLLPPEDTRAAIAAHLAYLTEDRKGRGLLLRFPLRPNLTLSTLDRFTRGPFINVAAEDEALDQAIAEFEVRASSRDMMVGALSGGNQQKLLFAKVMEAHPDILIADEPTRGVDIGTKQQIYHFIARLAAEGKGAIVVSSEMPELIGLCHRLLVMRAGRITGELEGSAIAEEEIVRYATGLKGAA